MYKAAIIGISGFGDVHYKDLVNEVNSGHAEVVAATVINQDQEADKCAWLKAHGAALYSDWQQMIKDFHGQIDLCFIPTGIYLHTPMSIAAVTAGANVFVEKPVAATVQEVKAIADAATQAGRFVAIGYQNIYLPETMKLKRLLLDGRIGKVSLLKAFALWPRDSVYYNRNNWAGHLRCNGNWVLDSPFNNALAHFLNLLCFYAGAEPERSAEFESIEAELYRANPIESCDTATLRIHCRDGKEVFFGVTHACNTLRDPVITIIGEKGKVFWNYHQTVIEYADGTREEWANTPMCDYRKHITGALRNRLGSPDAFVCDLQIGGAQTIVANGAHESSPIFDIPTEFITPVRKGEAMLTTVKDIDTIMEKSFDNAALLSEVGAPWGKQGKRFSLVNYHTFKGGQAL